MARVLRSVLVPCPWPERADCSGDGGRVHCAVGYDHREDILGSAKWWLLCSDDVVAFQCRAMELDDEVSIRLLIL
jgi:hypothetical protein